MRFGSVCSGIEAASQAWQPLGWKAAWLSEIEPFPCALLAHHYPDTPNFGDMTQFESWPDDEHHAIDLLCGGTPCQSFSVAGLRKGLDDDRGNLMLTFAAIAAKYRPKWLVWENVPGVLSSNSGRDFASFLGLLSGQVIEPPKEGWGNSGIITGYHNAYSLAYRVLDAQYFGVAQRRNRVFVVGCLGANRSAAAVLFERQSLSGDFAPSRSKNEKTTKDAFDGSLGGGQQGDDFGDADASHFIPTVASGKPTIGCLMANAGTKLWLGNQEALTGDYHILHPVKSYSIAGNIIGRQPENGGNGNGFNEEISYTLTKTDQHGVVAPTLCSNGDAHRGFRDAGGLVCQPIAWSEELTASIDCAATMQRGGQGGRHEGVMTQQMQVRRLTPTECERLQGFEDGYTNVPHRGKPAADGNRYKALGNSWAVPCARWVGERIQIVEALNA